MNDDRTTNRILIRCYPARWRDRYGDEFLAILEERPLGPYDVADILLGALDARLRQRGRNASLQEGSPSMSLRIGGIAALLGGALWAVGIALAVRSTVINGEPDFTAALLIGSIALLVAIAGMSAFQSRTHPFLTWLAFATAVAGTIVTIGAFGGLFGEASWTMFFVGLATGWIGFILFAVVTILTAALSRTASVLLLVGTVVPIAVMAAVGGGQGFAALTVESLALIASMACFPIAWLALGVQAIRLDRPDAVASSA